MKPRKNRSAFSEGDGHRRMCWACAHVADVGVGVVVDDDDDDGDVVVVVVDRHSGFAC